MSQQLWSRPVDPTRCLGSVKIGRFGYQQCARVVKGSKRYCGQHRPKDQLTPLCDVSYVCAFEDGTSRVVKVPAGARLEDCL